MNLTALLLCAAISSATANEDLYLPQDRLDVVCKYAPTIIEASKEQGISPFTLAALIYYESAWYTKSVSHAGACGLTQVIPKYSKYSCKQLFNPRTSIKEGALKLREWLNFTIRRDKREKEYKALACYNTGYACLENSRARQYAQKVSDLASVYKAYAYYVWCEDRPEDEECGC